MNTVKRIIEAVVIATLIEIGKKVVERICDKKGEE